MRIAGFTLPTEAQWEYACRAGTVTEYWSGDGEEALKAVGWYIGNRSEETHPVGEKPANPWGLYDMHGNVWEWCEDFWNDRAYVGRQNPAVDPERTEPKDVRRVIRGGSWFGRAQVCRSAFRGWDEPGNRDWYLGFRVCSVRSPKSVQADLA